MGEDEHIFFRFTLSEVIYLFCLYILYRLHLIDEYRLRHWAIGRALLRASRGEISDDWVRDVFRFGVYDSEDGSWYELPPGSSFKEVEELKRKIRKKKADEARGTV